MARYGTTGRVEDRAMSCLSNPPSMSINLCQLRFCILQEDIRHQEQQRAKPEKVLMSESWLPNDVALSGILVVADSGTQCIAQS